MKKIKDSLYWSRGCYASRNSLGEYSCLNVEGCHKLTVFDWLKNIPADKNYDIFEIRFKNTRKGFYRNCNNRPLQNGDVVAVEASPGHDIGIVSAMGPVAELKLIKTGINLNECELKKIYRKAKSTDIEKWQEAVSLEYSTMIKSRQITASLKLNMKIGDVEYQGDRTKAIFYYIADERVDFRELIKILAEEFRIRIEMRQIGARQEAGLIGGIGPCGRELCCAQWMHSFVSVATNAARYQEITINPQKLAGQCSKLKCCLNYELDTYIDALQHFPQITEPLQTIQGQYYLQKTDALKGLMWFSTDPTIAANLVAVPVDRVKEVIELNKQGKKIDVLTIEKADAEFRLEFKSVLEDDDITRFDKPQNKGKNNRRKRENNPRKGKRERNENSKKENKNGGNNPNNNDSPIKPIIKKIINDGTAKI
ncbi:MAG: hypothetical protein LBL90_12445 [Prevotellaceae bacterium]|jgi:cell fate regulator YaaT (PSP1 superfamily)|nr:hypothetical protein [Prevotellaceae bacterium]